jgi:hypothetical protein
MERLLAIPTMSAFLPARNPMITLEKETYFVSVTRIMQSQIQRLLTVISNAQIRWRSATGSSFILCSRWPGIPLEFNGCHYWKTTCLGQLAGLPMGVSGIFVPEFSERMDFTGVKFVSKCRHRSDSNHFTLVAVETLKPC